ncbi:MAG TPA: 3-ketoacyl-ACP reductase [Chthoniobacterales bacterium]|nr:3-ketoacyl-ACP reductase [Chthoniobacterales bacterium]
MLAEKNPNGVALVTGGRRGIGRAIAIALASKGFNVAVNDLVHDEALDCTISGIRAFGRDAISVIGDIAKLDGHEGLLRRVEAELGPIDCLVNNAGVMVPRRVDLLEISAESLDHLLAINLRGPLLLTRLVAGQMLLRSNGDRYRSIVNITSANAAMVSTEKSEYCISKAAMSMGTRLFAARLAVHGISVFEVRPGLIQTEMTRDVWEKYGPRIQAGLTPSKRWGEADEVGKTVAALASGELPFCTGSIINVDGGMQIQQL